MCGACLVLFLVLSESHICQVHMYDCHPELSYTIAICHLVKLPIVTLSIVISGE